jgi:uncharacterized membrane protein YdjX (TVP38/TMEM64 family)
MPEQSGVKPGGRRILRVRRLVLVVGAVLLAGLAASSGGVHQWVVHLIQLGDPVISRHPVGGALLFVGLAAVSAVLVFFSSVLLVPFGVHAWGETVCFLLLWIGWFLGGTLTYTIGRRVGWPIVRWVLSPEIAEEYEARIPKSRPFLAVLLAQIALPSEGVGYICGLLKVSPSAYLGALALAEMPYALGTVLLGAAFFERQYPALIALALAGLLLLGVIYWRQRGAASMGRPH